MFTRVRNDRSKKCVPDFDARRMIHSGLSYRVQRPNAVGGPGGFHPCGISTPHPLDDTKFIDRFSAWSLIGTSAALQYA